MQGNLPPKSEDLPWPFQTLIWGLYDTVDVIVDALVALLTSNGSYNPKNNIQVYFDINIKYNMVGWRKRGILGVLSSDVSYNPKLNPGINAWAVDNVSALQRLFYRATCIHVIWS